MSETTPAPRNAPPAHVRALDWWLARVWTDLAVMVGAVGIHAMLYRWWAWDHVSWAIENVSVDQRRFIYVGLATVAALVAGSNNTAVGSYVSSSGEVLKQVRISHGRSIRRSLRSNGLWLWIVAVISLVAVALDPMDSAHPHRTRCAGWIAEAALLLVVVKYARLLMLQDVLLAANDLSRQREVQQAVASRRRLRRPS